MRSLPKFDKEQEVLRAIEDPVLFAQVVLGQEMWSRQAEILYSVAQHSRTAVKACHASGKTFTAGGSDSGHAAGHLRIGSTS